MKLIIAGSRDFNDYEILKRELYYFLRDKESPTEIVSGKCKDGADALGERWAKEKGIPIKPFPANWEKHGKAAGPIRNKQMAEYADECICFWNGQSKGTFDMIKSANKYCSRVEVIYYD